MEIAQAWVGAGIADGGVPGRLVTGRLRAHPLDVVLGAVDRGVLPGLEEPMGEVWAPLVERMVGAG